MPKDKKPCRRGAVSCLIDPASACDSHNMAKREVIALLSPPKK